jgi:hypothetical protein
MPAINFSKFIENRIANIQASDSFAFAAAIGVGPWLVPLGPAIIFGYALYVSAPVDMAEFRIATAVAVAIGLVVAGAVSSHNAIVSSGWRPWSLVVGYIFLEIAGLWLMSVSFDVKVVGTVASLLTLVVYLSRSTAKEIDTAKIEAKEIDTAKRDFEIEQAKLNAEHQRQIEQAKLNAEHQRQANQHAADLAQTEHIRAMDQHAVDLKHDEKMARIEAKRVSQTVPSTVPELSQKKDLETLKGQIIAELGQEKPNMTQLAKQLGVGRGTLYRHLGTLNETGEVVKNGNGYKLPDND